MDGSFRFQSRGRVETGPVDLFVYGFNVATRSNSWGFDDPVAAAVTVIAVAVVAVVAVVVEAAAAVGDVAAAAVAVAAAAAAFDDIPAPVVHVALNVMR